MQLNCHDHGPSGFLTCIAAGYGGFHDGESHTLVNHSTGPSPHHLYTKSLLVVGNLDRKWHVSIGSITQTGKEVCV